MELCIIAMCDRSQRSKNLCDKHYTRYYSQRNELTYEQFIASGGLSRTERRFESEFKCPTCFKPLLAEEAAALRIDNDDLSRLLAED